MLHSRLRTSYSTRCIPQHSTFIVRTLHFTLHTQHSIQRHAPQSALVRYPRIRTHKTVDRSCFGCFEKVYYATAFTFVGCYINFPRGRRSSSPSLNRTGIPFIFPNGEGGVLVQFAIVFGRSSHRGGSSSSSSVPGGGLRTRVRARIGTACTRVRTRVRSVFEPLIPTRVRMQIRT